MAGTWDPSHLEDDITKVWLRGGGVTDNARVTERHNITEPAGYRHLSVREARAVDVDSCVARVAASRRRY